MRQERAIRTAQTSMNSHMPVESGECSVEDRLTDVVWRAEGWPVKDRLMGMSGVLILVHPQSLMGWRG